MTVVESIAAAESSIVSDDPLPDDFTAAREDDLLGGVGDNLDLDLVGMVCVMSLCSDVIKYLCWDIFCN